MGSSCSQVHKKGAGLKQNKLQHIDIKTIKIIAVDKALRSDANVARLSLQWNKNDWGTVSVAASAFPIFLKVKG